MKGAEFLADVMFCFVVYAYIINQEGGRTFGTTIFKGEI